MSHELESHDIQRTHEDPQTVSAIVNSNRQKQYYGLRYLRNYRDRVPETTTASGAGPLHEIPKSTQPQTSKASTYFSATGGRTGTIVGAQAKANQDALRIELKGSYDGPNARLLDVFFPFPKLDSDFAPHGDILPNLTEFYGDTERPSAKNSNGVRTEILMQGWKGIPEPPVLTEQPSILERDITKALVPIINAIISYIGLSDRRVAIDRQQKPIRTFGGNYLKPDVFLWGTGIAFPEARGVPLPKTQKEKRRKRVRDEPQVDWRWCVIPIEIKTERTRHVEDNQFMFQLAAYAREVLAAQPHRRFVPSLLFTESTVEFFLWDRAGVIFSEVLDYHAEAARFCHIIATIVSWSDEELGIDITMGFVHDGVHIWTGSHAYVVKAFTPVTQQYNIRSHGTACWRARRSDDNDLYLVQDTWSDDWEFDKTVWERIQDLRSKGRINSPVEWVSFDAVHTSFTAAGLPLCRRYVDSVNSNRRLVGVTNDEREANSEAFRNLDHGRSVWRSIGGDCEPLETFTSVLELIYVLRDVVEELKTLFLELGIVHRDIALWNVYIHRGNQGLSAERSTRGYLVDFSHAAFTYGRNIASRPDMTPGSHVFMSHRSLDKDRTTHCDDLESVYYILCFIIGCHTGLDINKSRLVNTPHPFDDWMHIKPWKVALYKRSHIKANGLDFQVQGVFKPLERLALNLHNFLQVRLLTPTTGYPSCSPFSPEYDYTKFLDCLDECIEEMTGNSRNQVLQGEFQGDFEETIDWVSGQKRVLINDDQKIGRDIKRAKTM